MLEINHLSKTFNPGTVNQKTAIRDISLKLNNGDFVTVIGGNGAGKSTLLNLIAGSYLADRGQIIINQTAIENLSEHQRARYIGRVFQDPMMGTCADMTIEENLAMALRRGKHRNLCWGISAKEKAFFKEQLKTLDLGLEERLTTKVGLLSGGQRQAITLFMATMMQKISLNETVEANILFALHKGRTPFYHRHLSHKDKQQLPWDSELEVILKKKVAEITPLQQEKLQTILNNLTKPSLLLLDEHTAALDPKTAKKVLDLTNQIIGTHHLTAIMITHNMKDALTYGNRLWMMDNGNLVLDIKEEQKTGLEVKDLLALFESQLDQNSLSDRMLLS